MRVCELRFRWVFFFQYQDVHGGGLDGDVDGVQVSLFNPPHPLDVHIKDADQVLGLHVLHSRFARR